MQCPSVQYAMRLRLSQSFPSPLARFSPPPWHTRRAEVVGVAVMPAAAVVVPAAAGGVRAAAAAAVAVLAMGRGAAVAEAVRAMARVGAVAGAAPAMGPAGAVAEDGATTVGTVGAAA